MSFKSLCFVCLVARILICSTSFSQNVNEFTGDFSYSVPLLTVPSPDGAGVPISGSYQAGISPMANSSEIGLGWSINAGGLISRKVNGIPDDVYKKLARTDMGGYVHHKGILHFKNGIDLVEVSDIYSTSYKLGDKIFFFPDYDNYFVSAPGIGGSIKPNLFEFASIEMKDGAFLSNSFSKKPNFSFTGEFSGILDSKYYPAKNPNLNQITNTTPLRLPGEIINGSTKSFTGGGYNDEDYSETINKNRLITPSYIEYYINSEINSHISGTNTINGIFINAENYNRTSSNCDLNGIGYFKITDQNGTTYHFALPVYEHSTIVNNYNLNNDYSLASFLNIIKSENGDNYQMFNRNSETDSLLLEFKQGTMHATNWMLTAITGVNFIDVNNNNLVDNNDKGYWVKYDWKHWSTIDYRYPLYGSEISNSLVSHDPLFNHPINTPNKLSGKTLISTTTKVEVYYLNSITTASHSALFVRDIRKDNFSYNPELYDTQKVEESLINGINTDPDVSVDENLKRITRNSWYGKLFDRGGKNGSYPIDENCITMIKPEGADRVKLIFNLFSVGSNQGNNDFINIYDGPDKNSPLIGQYNIYLNKIPPTSVESSGNSITIEFWSDNNDKGDAGFEIEWEALWNNKMNGWPNGRPRVIPMLKLNRILLLSNDDLSNLPVLTPITSNESYWDLSATTSVLASIYNENWYNTNKNLIDNLSIKSVSFVQDYSLCRKNISNINVLVNKSTKFSNQRQIKNSIFVASDKYNESGKLTLNKIVTYENKGIQITPSYIFDYLSNNLLRNPDFDPIAIDNWGFYKKDISDKGLFNYTTPYSALYVDAWSMGSITAPIGGKVSIEYEPKTYGKVISENVSGGARGPSKTYLFENFNAVNGPYGTAWNYTFEDQTSDLTNLLNNPPLGTTREFFIPFVTKLQNTLIPDQYISYGVGSLNTATNYVSGLSLYETTNGDHINNPSNYFTSDGYSPDNFKYTGNGFIKFDMPVGTSVYGGGPRVKSLTFLNGTLEDYKVEYAYEDGVAYREADKFNYPLKSPDKFNFSKYSNLISFTYDKHMPSPTIGYGKVTVKNLGQSKEQGNGSIISTFINNDNGIDNFKPIVQLKTVPSIQRSPSMMCNPESDIDSSYIIHVSDKFSSSWGLPLSQEIHDINNNIISKTINEYGYSNNGIVTELFNFYTVKIGGPAGGGAIYCDKYKNYVSILREYPVKLLKSTTYKNGTFSEVEPLEYDAVTGDLTKAKLTNADGDISETWSYPAFRISGYSDMGPKAINSLNKNILSTTSETKSINDKNLTNGLDFNSYSVNTFSNNLKVREFDNSTNLFSTKVSANSNWISDKSFVWTGPLSTYGLFNAELFEPFNHVNQNANGVKWRLNTEVTLLNKKGHLLESKTFNNRYSAVKYCHNDKFVIGEISNSNYESFTVSSFEEVITPKSGYRFSSGEVNIFNNQIVASTPVRRAHTGNYYIQVLLGQQGPMYKIKFDPAAENKSLQRGRKYHASVWVHTDSPSDAQLVISIDGNTSAFSTMAKSSLDAITIGNWIQLNVFIDVPENYVSSGGTNNDLRVYLNSGTGNAYFDDLRLHCVDAPLTSFIIDERTGRRTAILDHNNFATIFKHDEAGRVTEIWQEFEGVGLRQIKVNEFHFAREME